MNTLADVIHDYLADHDQRFAPAKCECDICMKALMALSGVQPAGTGESYIAGEETNVRN